MLISEEIKPVASHLICNFYNFITILMEWFGVDLKMFLG